MPGFFDSMLAGQQQRQSEQDAQVQRQRQATQDQRQGQQYAQSQQDRLHHQVAQAAIYLHSLPPERRAAAYQGFVPLVRAAFPGEQIPDKYDPSVEDAITKIVTMAGGEVGNASTGIQSTFVDARGIRMGVTRDGRTVPLGENAPSYRPIQGEDGVYGFDPRTNSAAPTMVGGQPPQPAAQPSQAVPQAGGVVLDDATLQQLLSVPVNERASFLAGAQGGGAVFHPGPNGEAVPSPSAGAQLRPPAKAGAGNFSQLSPDEVKAIGLPAGTVAQRGPDGKVDVITKPDPKSPVQSQATMRRNQSAADTSQATIDTIDRLTASPGYKALGTMMGDVATNVPFVRTDAKDAQQQLDVLGGQIALSTMSSLKALSAQGATGFGALNREELKLLQNAVASLQAGNLSHDQLDKNIQVIREKMDKINRASVDALDGVDTSAPTAPNSQSPAAAPVIRYDNKGNRIK